MLQKIKHLFAVLLLAGFAAQPAFAESFNQDDMAFAFGNSAMSSDLGDMALLSNQEMMETEGELIPFVIGAFHAIRYARYAVGPLRSWVRYGSSYSRNGGFRTTSLRWGSNSHYRNQIGSSTLRNWNSRLHNFRISSRSWRTRDTGHFHFRRW